MSADCRHARMCYAVVRMFLSLTYRSILLKIQFCYDGLLKMGPLYIYKPHVDCDTIYISMDAISSPHYKSASLSANHENLQMASFISIVQNQRLNVSGRACLNATSWVPSKFLMIDTALSVADPAFRKRGNIYILWERVARHIGEGGNLFVCCFGKVCRQYTPTISMAICSEATMCTSSVTHG